jgi:hypothetical protein
VHDLPATPRRVLRSLEGPLDDTVPAARTITVEDLLTFRLGFGIIMVPPGTYPIQEAEVELGLMTLGPPWPPPPFGADRHCAPDAGDDIAGAARTHCGVLGRRVRSADPLTQGGFDRPRVR